tara:strand:- start:296 stop:733 length:438 start_codon:yes stop_codon:yes gene_type:complete
MRQVPISISHSQAHDILADDQKANNNISHCYELILSLVSLGGLKLEQVIIETIKEDTFKAALYIRKVLRPNSKEEKRNYEKIYNVAIIDGIALAIKSNCKIFMQEENFSKRSIPIDTEKDIKDQIEFKEFIDNIKPSDLTDYLNS